jgi:hypothetical protein
MRLASRPALRRPPLPGWVMCIDLASATIRAGGS